MEYSEMKKRVQASIAETRQAVREQLRSLRFVYRGKKKDSLPVKRGYHDDFWVATFEIDASFTDAPVEKSQLYSTYTEIMDRNGNFRLHYDFTNRGLTYSVRIGPTSTDIGTHIDVDAERIVALLNSEAMKLVVETYLVYSAAKKVLNDNSKQR